ncbi:MAG: PorT family protein [Cytophagales bacterium]|nr:PorT family protein [Cytophagales bacterium]
MKKIVGLALLLLICSTTLSQAQARFGIRGGLNVARWQGDAVQSLHDLVQLSNGTAQTRSLRSFHAGGYVALPVTSFLTVEPGLYYSQKGYTLEGTFSSNALDFINARATVTNRSHYIDLPVLAKVYVTEGFHLFGGPQVSYLVHNSVRTRASVLGFSLLNQELNATSNLQKWDVGLTGGVGYKFENGFNLQAAYDHGLRRLDARDNFDTYNRVVKVSLGYEF